MFTNLDPFQIIVFIASMVIALSVHEAMHAFTAHYLGDNTAHEEGRLTLNPLKHIDVFTSILLPLALVLVHLPPFFIARPVPIDPRNIRYGEFGTALVGVAGPLSNFGLAALAAIFAKIGGVAVGTDAFIVVSIFMLVNISFFVFNMIPFPPLDGSRLLYAFAPDPLRDIMERIESAGFVTIVVFMLILFPFFSGTIGSLVSSLYTFLLTI